VEWPHELKARADREMQMARAIRFKIDLLIKKYGALL
jgi:hypothetical protein